MTLNDQKRIIDLWVQFWGGNEMEMCIRDSIIIN